MKKEKKEGLGLCKFLLRGAIYALIGMGVVILCLVVFKMLIWEMIGW